MNYRPLNVLFTARPLLPNPKKMLLTEKIPLGSFRERIWVINTLYRNINKKNMTFWEEDGLYKFKLNIKRKTKKNGMLI